MREVGKWTIFTGLFAVVLGVGLAGVLFIAPELVVGHAVSCCVYLLLWLLVGVATSACWLLVQNQQRRTVQHGIELLCRLDPHDLANDPETRALPTIPEGHPWHGVFHQVRDCLLAYGRRFEEAEHARASAEVRVKRLSDDREHVNEVLTCLADPVLAIDNFDELVLANASAEKLLEIKRNGGGKQSLASLVRCEALVDLLTETRRHKTATHRTGEISLADEHGAQHWYRVTCTTLAGRSVENAIAGENSVHGAVAVLNDISGEKTIQKRNAEFVSAVSHEMKTPLAGIKAYVELLVDGDAEDETTREEFLGVINSQADRLQRLIDNLLNLARIEAGVVEVDKRLESLNELLEEAAEVVRPSAEDKHIKLVRELSSMYLGVLADRDMVLQSAINLLSNAIKYTPAGGTVTLRSRQVDHDAEFEVEDTGVGLSEEDRLRVFEKFYRVKKDSQMASGTGLGLPLAKHIVEDVHGGRLTVDSKPGRGSTFRVTLPNVGKMTT